MSKKTYNVSTTARTARPRSKRLRELGGVSVTVVGVVGVVGGGSGSGGGDTHTHTNKSALDALSIDNDDYLHVSQYKEQTQTLQTHKVRAGYADQAEHAKTADDALRAEEAEHAQQADNADRWDGREFSDYLDQPVRKGDKVQFGQVTTPTIVTPDFTPGGFAGAGAGLTRDVNGQTTLEVDNIVARRRLNVNEVIINQSTHVGGRTLFSAANMECVRVEDGGTYWRCYFDTKNGQKANLWQKDDLAYYQQYSPDNTQIVRYYWRLVTSVGEDWINLSKTTCDTGSGTPAVGDNIVQVGNLTDRRRQSMLEIDMMGASRVVLYAGINTFSFVDRNEGALGVDEQGEPYFYCYGDAFIGDRNLSDPDATYITFQTPEGETRRRMIVSADLHIGRGSTGLANLSEWHTKQAEIDHAGQAAADAQAAANEAARKAQEAKDYLDNTLPAELSELNRRMDGVVENWFLPYTPSSDNAPASAWTTAAERLNHVGDTFTNTQAFLDEATTPDAGKSWRWVDAGGYRWTPIADSDAVKALQQAARAQDTADAKRRNFVVQPSTPYDVGDMWMQGASGEVMRCIRSRQSGACDASDWDKAAKYTDDSAVNNLQVGGRNYVTDIANWALSASAAQSYFREHTDGSGRMALYNNTGYSVVHCPVFFRSGLNVFSFDIEAVYAMILIIDTRIGIIGSNVEEYRDNIYFHLPAGFKRRIELKLSGESPSNIYFQTDTEYVLCYIGKVKFEKGNKATDWTPAPEDVQAEIDKAQADATAANSAIAAMNDDGILDISEKQSIRTQWEAIQGVANTTSEGDPSGSYQKTVALAGVKTSTEQLTTLYTTLRGYLDGAALYANTNTSDFARTTLAAHFKNYYNEEAATLDRISRSYVDEVQVGDRNLLLQSNKGWDTSDYRTALIELGDYKPKAGEECTLVVKGRLGEGKFCFGVYNSSGSVLLTHILSGDFDSRGIAVKTFPWDIVDIYGNTSIHIYALHNTVVVSSQIEWVKLVVGNKTSKIWTASPEDIKAEIDGIQTSAVNYLKDSRMDNLSRWVTADGTVTLVEDPKFGTVVQYQRLLGWGGYQHDFDVYNRSQFSNCDVIYYVIAKAISDGSWSFGGWPETVSRLSNSSNSIDLGDGWRMYWVSFKAGAILGTGTFGINSIMGTWQFYAAGVSLGKNPPSSWTIAEGDLKGSIATATARLDMWASDDIISPVEKTGLRQQRAAIDAEYAQLKSEAERYSVSIEPYTAAYNAALAALNKYAASSPDEIPLDKVANDYAHIAAYYTAAEGIRNAVGGVTDVSYLRKAFGKGSTDISGGVVLSEFIGVKEGENVVAGMTKGTVNGISIPLLFTGADDLLSAMQTATWYLDKEGVQKSRNKSRTQSVTLSDGGIVFANIDASGREVEAMSVTPELLRPASFDKPFSDPNVGLIAEPAGNRSLTIAAIAAAEMEGGLFQGGRGYVGDEQNPAMSLHRRLLYNVELGSSAVVSISKFTIELNFSANGYVWSGDAMAWRSVFSHSIQRVCIALINRNTGTTKYLFDENTSEYQINIPALSCTDLARGSYELFVDIRAPKFMLKTEANDVTTTGTFSMTESTFTASWSGGACNSKIFGNGFLFSKTSNNYCGIIGDERNFVFEQRSGNYGFRADNTGSKVWCAARNEWIPADRVLYKGWVKGAGRMDRSWAYKGNKPAVKKISPGVYEVDLRNSSLEAITHYLVRCTGTGTAYTTDHRYASPHYIRNGVFNVMTVWGTEVMDDDFFFEVVDTSDLKA